MTFLIRFDATSRVSVRAAALFVALALFISASAVALAQSHSGRPQGIPSKDPEPVSAAEIAKPGELADVGIGKPDAKITIIEYASLTCGHCGNFHREILPELKKKYIDTGMARLILREFPLENVAAAAAMITRCAGTDKTYAMASTLLERQQQWLASDDVRDGLVAIAKEFGMKEAAFDSCLKDRTLLKKVAAARDRAYQTFGVNSTPTFFINGTPLVGPRSIDDFDKIIAPMLK